MKAKSDKKQIRQSRRFSESLKRSTVKDIEQNKLTVLEASRELSVSKKSIYDWIYKYSSYLEKQKVLVVEEKSLTKKTEELTKRLLEVEAALGRKQIELDILNKMIELASAELKIDLKKSFIKRVSSGSDKIKG